MEDYDYDNPADRDAYCPDMDNNDDAYGKQNAPDTDKPDIGNINKNCKNLGYFVSVFCAANHFGLFHCDIGGGSFLYRIFWQLLRQIPVPSNSAVVAYTNN